MSGAAAGGDGSDWGGCPSFVMSIFGAVGCCCAGMPTRDRARDRAGRVVACGVRASTVGAAGSAIDARVAVATAGVACGAGVSGCAVGVDGAMAGLLVGVALLTSPVSLVGTAAGVGGRCGPRDALLANSGVRGATGCTAGCWRAGGVATVPRSGAAAGNSCVGGVGASMRVLRAGAGGGGLAVAVVTGAGAWGTLAVLTMGVALRLVSSDAASVGGALVVAMPALATKGWVGGRSAGGRAVRGSGRVGSSWVGASVGRGAATERSPSRRAMGVVVLLGRSVRGAVGRVLVDSAAGANSHSGVTSFSWT